MQRGVAIGPTRLVGLAIKAVIFATAASDLNAQGRAGRETGGIIDIARLGIGALSLGVGRGAWSGRRDSSRTRTEVEVADLIGEGDVVGVDCPRHVGLFRRRAVHRVEVVRQVVGGHVTIGAVGIELHLGKAVGSAGYHETALPGGLILDIDAQALRGIVHGGGDRIP